MKSSFKNIIAYLNDQSIDIRIRMMFFLEYATLIACLIGSICMILLNQPVSTMFSNIILFIMSFISLYFSHAKKQYDLATIFLVIGCANIALPWMYFTAGGNNSGMPIWMLFSVVVTCLMTTGKIRIVMSSFTIIEDMVCIVLGQFKPEMVTELIGNDAEFYDELQSYAVVCICLTVILAIYLTTYDTQRKKMEAQSIELQNIIRTDALTGMFNRRAYYEETNDCMSGDQAENLVLVALDVNGLKKINDLRGHAAGDDYIREAANVISQSLGKYGHIFRTGGDEFMAVLHCTVEEAHSFEKHLDESIAGLENEWADKMSIAVGVVCCEENPGVNFTDIEKMADKKMYENKAAYYRNKGIDRRK